MTDFGAVWLNAMFQGDLESAWLASDRILANPIAPDEHRKPRHLQRIWNGQALENKRVLVRCYHGLGDTIQFARFLPGLVGHAASVMTWIQPELLTLMRMQSGFGEFLPLHDGTPDVEYDVDIEIMELAHALRATNEMISASVPYLRVNEICDELRRHNGDNGEARTPKVGIAWRAGNWDIGRSLSADALQALACIPGIEWHVLQLGVSAASYPQELGPPPESSEILVAAKRMTTLDLVLSVDSMPAHLAGALGVPVLVLLRANADWRWGKHDQTPWYPSMRLIRQKCEGDWTDPLRTLVHRLTRDS